jgi:hypothetical protein
MPKLVINGTAIDFPDSGTDPNWAEAVIQFATQTQNALEKIGLPSDVSPQTLIISADNPGTNVPISSLAFSILTVRAVFVKYAVYRTTSTSTVYEAGELVAVYNPNGSLGSLWELQREFVGNADITFTMTDAGQIEFSTTALSGLNHYGILSFSASTLTQV